MMLALIIILLFLISAWIGICFLLTNLLVRVAIKLLDIKSLIRKGPIFVASVIIAGCSICWYLLTSPAENHKTGHLETFQDKYKVTITGKRVPMSHDPISALLRSTYDDSISYIIPRPVGVIQGNEIRAIGNTYNKLTGTIRIEKQEMTIELVNAIDENMADSWNGKYRLERR